MINTPPTRLAHADPSREPTLNKPEWLFKVGSLIFLRSNPFVFLEAVGFFRSTSDVRALGVELKGTLNGLASKKSLGFKKSRMLFSDA